MSGSMFTLPHGDGTPAGIAELDALLAGEDAADDYDEFRYEDEDEDGEGPVESLLRHSAEIEAGLWPGWKLDRTHPGVLVWTTPAGRRYASTLDGRTYRPFPAGSEI